MTSDQRQRRREGSRRAQAARDRRTEARQRRGLRNKLYISVGVILAIALAIGAFVFFSDGDSGFGFAVPQLAGSHSPPYVYNQDILIDGEPARIPPTSGNHFDAWLRPWGFQGDTLVPERAVHNMEHGGVVIWYQPHDPELAGKVNQLVRRTGDQCIIAGSYPDMTFEVAATVWGRVLPLEHFDQEELLEFIQAYRGSLGPEAGICRTDP